MTSRRYGHGTLGGARDSKPSKMRRSKVSAVNYCSRKCMILDEDLPKASGIVEKTTNSVIKPFAHCVRECSAAGLLGSYCGLPKKEPSSVCILTILLKMAGHDKIDKLDLEKHRGILRQRLLRAGLGSAVVIGGFENVYRARQKEWVLHINLVVIGGQKTAIDKFKTSFEKSNIKRALMEAPVKNAAKQLSYLLKFTTYHRPHERRGSSKGEARPLNAREHLALVQWMSTRPFKAFMFLFNAHQGVNSIVAHRNVD